VALLRAHRHEGGDGLVGGTPHLHAIASETYLCVSGRGRLLVIDRDGPAEHRLDVGQPVACGPGTISRLVDDGGLVVVLVVDHDAMAASVEGGDVVVPGAPDGDQTIDHIAAVNSMRSIAEALEEQVLEPYVRLHRAVPRMLGAVLEPLGEVVPTEDRAQRARHHLERLGADDVHHLLDAVAGPLPAMGPCCAELVGTPVA